MNLSLGFGLDKYRVQQGTLLNQIPAANLATMWLDGSIVDVAGSKYFVDKKAGNNILITGYDFSTGWTTGFPYKSAATIDIFGQTAVPVISLFQNFDYANKYFCKHKAQVVDGNGIETYEPRVLDIVAYSEALTGDDLTNANTYFGVPAIVAGAKYVPGDYATNTAAIAAVSAGATIYNKSGAKTEAAALSPNKALTIKGIGFSVNNPTGTPAALVTVNNGSCTIAGLILSGNDVVTRGFRIYVNDVIVDKIKMHSLATNQAIVQENGSGLIIRNSVFDLIDTIKYFFWTGNNALLENSYIKGSFVNGMISNLAAVTDTQSIRYCRIITKNKLVYSAALISNFKYNKVNAVDLNTELFSALTADNTLNVEYNEFELTGTPTLLSCLLWHNIVATTVINLKNNRYTSSNGVGLLASVAACKSGVISNNYAKLLDCLVSFATVTETLLVDNNTFASYGADTSSVLGGIVVASETGVQNGVITITKNKVLNPKYFNPALGGLHDCILVKDYVNPVIKYNRLAGGGAWNMVVKSATHLLNTESVVSHNVSINNGITVKGCGNSKIYNNTVINAGNISGLQLSAGDDSSAYAAYDVKNNIVVNAVGATPLIDIVINCTGDPHAIDYNVYYSTAAKPFQIAGVTKTFAEWQALGYDAHSIMLTEAQYNALLTANYTLAAGSAAIGAGVDLGAAYDDGLDSSTAWGTDTELPVIVTKQQAAAWDCGAYVF